MRKLLLAGAMWVWLFVAFTHAVDAGLFEWSRLGRLNASQGPEPYVTVIVPHPTAPQVLYAGSLLTTEDAALLYHSADGGASWSAITAGLPALPDFAGVQDLLLWPGEEDVPDSLLVALQGAGLWRSSDGGANWEPAVGGSLGANDTVRVLLAMESTTLALTSEGIHSIQSNGNWKVQSSGLPPAGTAFYYDMAADPSAVGAVYAAVGTMGIYSSTDGGLTWAATNGNLPGPPYDAREVAVNPLSGELFASLRGAGLFRSADGGQTWVASQAGITYETTLYGTIGAPVVSPADGRVAFVYNSDGIFRSEDGGVNWQPYAEGLTGAETITALAFHPGRANTILAGTSISGVWDLTLPSRGQYYLPFVR